MACNSIIWFVFHVTVFLLPGMDTTWMPDMSSYCTVFNALDSFSSRGDGPVECGSSKQVGLSEDF